MSIYKVLWELSRETVMVCGTFVYYSSLDLSVVDIFTSLLREMSVQFTYIVPYFRTASLSNSSSYCTFLWPFFTLFLVFSRISRLRVNVHIRFLSNQLYFLISSICCPLLLFVSFVFRLHCYGRAMKYSL